MGNNIIVKGLIVFLIPIAVLFVRDYVKEFLASQETIFVDLTPMENIERVVNENRPSVDMLKAYNPGLATYDVLANVSPDNLSLYFRPPPPPPSVNAEGKVIEKPKPPVYLVDFVFLGDALQYVSIGNELLQVGNKTSKGEVIKNIENNRIQLQGRWGLRWIPVNF